MDPSTVLLKMALVIFILIAIAFLLRRLRGYFQPAGGKASGLIIHQSLPVSPRQRLLVFEFDRRVKLVAFGDQFVQVLAEKGSGEEL